MIKCIAIDDEPIALNILERFCLRRGGMQLACYTSPRAGMMAVNVDKPDVVFLDIEMNDVSGLELARNLPPTCCLIFTTAYARYALDGYEVNAVDFLHKPFFYERFCRAIDKAEQWLAMRRLMQTAQQPDRRLTLKADYKTVAVSIDTILYIEALDNYVRLHLADGTSVMSKMALRTLCDSLPAGEFVQIHRSFVVPKAKVTRFTRTEVHLSGAARPLPIGRTYAAAVAASLSE